MDSEYRAHERFDWGDLARLIIGVGVVVLIERVLRVRDWWRRHVESEA